ncbi:class II aldolase/adducin family protein, partial [Streptococcus pneumoniae]|uniref:class II aldolase/adducin family protein n=1 Tax=Streptococcus pneumoniae TaxID=1313 RepID=UPI0011569088
ATPTGISKSFITPEKLVKLNLKGEILEAEGDYCPSSEIKMHIRCYEEREDVRSVVHAHPPIATGFALAHIPLDTYSLIESENHGALTVGSDVITAYYRMETLELVAKTTFHGRMLLSTKGIEEQEIARPTLERL